jgi:choline kinase
MKAIILAAGRGSRMKELTDDRPKCLVELRGMPLLEWQLQAIRGAGIVDIAIVTGYKRELLCDRGLVEFHNPRWAETNMVASLACAQEWLQADTCIVSYSDIFYDASAVRSLMECDADIAVTYDPNWLELWKRRFGDPLLDAETFRLNADGSLAEIGSKPNSVEEVQGQYMGLLRFTPAGWADILRVRTELSPQVCDNMHMTGTLQRLISGKKAPIRGVSYAGRWGEIDSLNDLSSYQ